MLLDLQGSGFHLFDPEIASTNIIDGGEFLYSNGNLSGEAIDYFVEQPKCNAYCRAVGLLQIEKK